VVATLNGIAPYDWATFLRGRLDGHGSLTGGLDWLAGLRAGLPRYAERRLQGAGRAKAALLAYSLGATVLDSGTVGDVIWDSPAFNAGLAPA
jgi:predicted metalloprotease with PDZ domain